MLPILSCVFILSRLSTLSALKDLDTAAITVYRNPDFFRHLSDDFNNHIHQFSKDPYNYGDKDQYKSPVNGEDFFHHLNEQYENTFPNDREHQETDEGEINNDEHQEEDENYSDVPENHRENYKDGEENEHYENQGDEVEDTDDYKYPGEPKKPNPPFRPSVNVHFDGSPDFHHPGRNVPSSRPNNKGRGPYGHPKYARNEYPPYSEEYEEDRNKSEEEQLAEIEEDSRRENEEQGLPPPQKYYKEYSRNYPYNNDEPSHVNHPVPLKVFHNGQRLPLEHEEYIGHEDVHYPLKSKSKVVPERFDAEEEIRDTKKGTREYLRHANLPPHHELRESEPQKNYKPKRVVKVGCDTRIVPKERKNRYIAYSVRPIYSKYRIVPFQPKTVRQIYYLKPSPGHFKRRSVAAPKLVEDNSAYDINSELDGDYQTIEVVRPKKKH